MPFRCRQKYRPATGCSVVDFNEVELPSGEYTTVTTDLSDTDMPSPELFDIKAQLQAGVTQEEVNSKVISGSTVDAAQVIRKYTKSSNKVTTEDSHEDK